MSSDGSDLDLDNTVIVPEEAEPELEDPFEVVDAAMGPPTRSEQMDAVTKQAELEAKLEVQGQTIAEQTKMLGELKQMLLDIQAAMSAAATADPGTSATGGVQQQQVKPVITTSWKK